MKSSRLPFILLLLVSLVAVGLGYKLYYNSSVTKPKEESVALNQSLFLQSSGLTSPTTNGLAPQFSDADNDLIADAPTEPAKLLDPPVLHFSYIAEEDAEPYQTAFKDFCAHLAKVTGKQVEYVSYATVDDELKAFAQGRLEVAGLNTGNVPRAVDSAGFVPVAAPAGMDGSASYRCILIAPISSPVKTLADLKNQEILLTDAGSNSGYRAPLIMLKAAGLLPVRDYTLRYSGSHDASIAAIAHNEAKLAAVASNLLQRALDTGAIKADQYTKIAESETFPVASLGYAYNLNHELAAKIAEAMFSYDVAKSPLAEKLQASKFVPVHYREDFELVRKIDNECGMIHKLP